MVLMKNIMKLAQSRESRRADRVYKINKDPDVELLCIKKELQKSFQKFYKNLYTLPKAHSWSTEGFSVSF